MKILVTGGLGFIGHNIVVQLEALGHEVCVVDAKKDYLGTIPAAELEYLTSERQKKIKSKVHCVDVADLVSLEAVYSSFDPEVVIHNGQYPRQKQVNANPQIAAQEIFAGMLNLLELAKKYKTRKFSFVSNSLVYGEYAEPVREDSQESPLGAYAVMKYACELFLKDYARETGMEYNILRPSAVYGPLANYFVDRITRLMVENIQGKTMSVEGEDEMFDFTFVEDAAAGIVGAAVGGSATNGKIYNVTYGTAIRYADAAKLVAQIAGKGDIEVLPSNGEYGRIRSGHPIDAAKQDYGFEPRVSREEGFKRLYEWLNNSVYWSQKTV
jgi:nucleoside-diphosphate-sugar epimerase